MRDDINKIKYDRKIKKNRIHSNLKLWISNKESK